MTPERVWEARAQVSGAVVTSPPTTVDDAVAAMAARCAPGRRRHRPRRRRASGQGAAARDASSRSTASTSCAGSSARRRWRCGSARSRRHAEIAANTAVRERFTALADASAIVGSHATRAQGTIGGNLMNASPAMETGGPLVCFGATVDAALAVGRARRSPSPSFDRARADDRRAGRAARRGRRARPGRAAPGSCLRPPRVPPADGDRRRRRDRASSRSTAAR